MTRSAREVAMLREMGIRWLDAVPQVTARPAPAEPAVESAVKSAVESAVESAAESVVESAAPTAVTALGWEALQQDVAQCRRCGLCRTRRHTVFGVGHPQAHWMVVGEAPGEQEDQQGEPFVGAAGQLLDRMLASIGLTRAAPVDGDDSQAPGDPAQRVFITNTVKCRPPQNRNPQPEELAACAPVLQRQIELVRPRIVLAMGRFAAQQLLATEEPIGRLRGRAHALPGRGVPVVVTYHPAYLLRNPVDKSKAWADLCLALDTLAAAG